MNETDLLNLGLTLNEAKVYLALLHLGKANGSEIAKRSQVHRRNVYDALERLIQRGLIGYIAEGRVRYYLVEDPATNLGRLIEEKKQSFEKILPEAKELFKVKKPKDEVSVLHGIEGKKAHFAESIEEAKNRVVYLFVPSGLVEFATAPYSIGIKKLYNGWRKNNAKVKMLLPDSAEARHRAATLQEFSDILKIKYSKQLRYSANAWHVVEDIVFLTFFSEPLLIIRIKSKEIAKGFKNNFELLWKTV